MRAGLAWIVALTVGLLAGGFAFHFPGSYGEPTVSVGAAIFGFILGAVNGLLVGLLAWIALRLPRSAASRLLLALVLIVGATHALNDGSSTQVPFVVVQVLAGLAAAAVAAWALGLRRPSDLAVVGGAWAVGLVVAGWSGDVIGLPLTETPVGWAQDHAWDGLVTGLVWGAATAAVGLSERLRGDRREDRTTTEAHAVR